MISYNVSCEFDDPDVMDRWIEWINEVHLADVCAAGAIDARVVRFDGESHRCEVRYRFASREDFARYERDHAPRLREDGLRQFPLSLGLRYIRSTGMIVGQYPVA